MPRCRDCKLYDLDAVKNARGAVMASRVGACGWRSKEKWPESVRDHLNSRPSPSLMAPNDVHRCPCFQKANEVTHG